jgi:hypothetical protein
MGIKMGISTCLELPFVTPWFQSFTEPIDHRAIIDCEGNSNSTSSTLYATAVTVFSIFYYLGFTY